MHTRPKIAMIEKTPLNKRRLHWSKCKAKPTIKTRCRCRTQPENKKIGASALVCLINIILPALRTFNHNFLRLYL